MRPKPLPRNGFNYVKPYIIYEMPYRVSFILDSDDISQNPVITKLVGFDIKNSIQENDNQVVDINAHE
jgi:hypothetical protein